MSRRIVRAQWCYLWTFTFPDDVDVAEAAERWAPLANRMGMLKLRFVRVLERGKRGHKKWHFHCVTPDRWEVSVLRPLAELYGFGRINVKQIPAEKAAYVAKYVGKQFGRDADKVGVRAWGCTGFTGSTVSNTRIVVSVDNSQLMPIDRVVDAITYSWDGASQLTVILRGKHARPMVGEPVISQMEFKKHQAEELLKELSLGNCIVVGEYRGFAIRTIKYADKKTGAAVERLVVEHNVEVNGAARVVTEWLPPGANGAGVKPAANRGDLVRVLVESSKQFGSQVSYGGGIKSLTQIV